MSGAWREREASVASAEHHHRIELWRWPAASKAVKYLRQHLEKSPPLCRRAVAARTARKWHGCVAVDMPTVQLRSRSRSRDPQQFLPDRWCAHRATETYLRFALRSMNRKWMCREISHRRQVWECCLEQPWLAAYITEVHRCSATGWDSSSDAESAA